MAETISILTQDTPDETTETTALVAELPQKQKEQLLQYLSELEAYIKSNEYYRHMKQRGYSDEEIAMKRNMAEKGIADVKDTSDNLRSFATIFASAPPQELRKEHIPAGTEAQAWYSFYSSLLEATTLHEAVHKMGFKASSDIVDKLMIGTAYSFGHTSKRTGVAPNYYATQKILSGTLKAIENAVQERMQNGNLPNVKDAIKTLIENKDFQKRLAEHIFAETGVAEWETPQKTQLKIIKRTKGSGETVSATAPPSGDLPNAVKKMRGNTIFGVWSMFNALRGKDAKEAVEFGAQPFSATAKKTLNYAYQIISEQKYNQTAGRQLLPHDPLTVRDVWETAGTLGQLRNITDTEALPVPIGSSATQSYRHTRLNLDHINNIFVPLGFRIGYDSAKKTYTATPIDAVWTAIANDPEELRFYQNIAKEVIPSRDIPEVELEEGKGEIPFFRSEKETETSVFHVLKGRKAGQIKPEELKKTIANPIVKHLNELDKVAQMYTIGTDIDANGNKRYWIGFNAQQAEAYATHYKDGNLFDDLSLFDGNGVTIIRDKENKLQEIRVYQDEAHKIFQAEAGSIAHKNAINRFAQFVTKTITNNDNLFAGFVPAIVETYTIAEDEYRNNVAILRQQLEAELPKNTIPQTTLKQRFQTMLSPAEGKPYSQTIQPQCWVAYRNAVKAMGVLKPV